MMGKYREYPICKFRQSVILKRKPTRIGLPLHSVDVGLASSSWYDIHRS